MPIVPRSQSPMPSGTSPLPADIVASARANAAALSDAVQQAQQATNSLVFRSPWDWRSAGINLMKDVARSNNQRYVPGIFPPFGGPVPTSFLPLSYPPGVLIPASEGVGMPGGGDSHGLGQVTPVANPGIVPAGRTHYGGTTRGMRAGKYDARAGESARAFPSRFDAARDAAGRGIPGTGGSGAGSGLIGQPFTQAIAAKGAPPASVQPAGGGTTPAYGPNGSQGFTGRAIQRDPTAQGVNIVGPQTGTPPVPPPNITIDPQPVEPPVLPAGMRGMGAAFPTGCTPNPGISATVAAQTDAAVAAAQQQSQGSSWWAWLLVIGLAVVIANSGDDSEREKTRGHAKR